MIKFIKYLTLLLSISSFALSLTQPAFCTGSITNSNCFSSLSALLMGWAGILLGSGPAVCWMANPFLLITWILLFIVKPSYVLSTAVFSVLIMFSFLKGGKIILDEAGHQSKIISFGLGYWLWIMSGVIVIIGSGFVILLVKNKTDVLH